MRRPAVAICCALLVVLAGCSLASAPQRTAPATDTDVPDGTTTDSPPTTASPTTPPTTRAPTTTTVTATPPAPTELADPETDRIGWEAGYWANESIAVTQDDGLNESERAAVVGRAMARVERIRGREFEQSVPVEVVAREDYGFGGGNGSTPPALETFDNAKFEALFLIGEDEESIGAQRETLNRTVLGAYSRVREAIVVVSDSETPSLRGETTLAHELVHALQDQHFDPPPLVGTRDAYNGRNGLLEGDATVVQRAYRDRCGTAWRCLGGGGGGQGTASAPPHFGLYFLEFFPYESGPAFVEHLRRDGGWAAVDAAYQTPPTTARVVLDPSLYGTYEPRTVTLPETAGEGWQRVRPPDRPDYAALGQSALAAGFAYTLYDTYDPRGAIAPTDFLNMADGAINQSDPLNYRLSFLRGWDGDRMHVYERGGETGYVWRLAWDNATAAERFAQAYRRLISHWGASPVAGETWRIAEDSPFADAIRITVSGDTVTIVNAPTTDALDALAPGTG